MGVLFVQFKKREIAQRATNAPHQGQDSEESRSSHLGKFLNIIHVKLNGCFWEVAFKSVFKQSD